MEVVQVVSGFIAQNQCVWIGERAEGDYAGKWECPGGKVDPGETDEIALARELKEELGITAIIGDRMATTPILYTRGKRIPFRVVMYRVVSFTGMPECKPGIHSAAHWVPYSDFVNIPPDTCAPSLCYFLITDVFKKDVYLGP